MVKVKEDMTGWNMWEHGVPDSRLTVIRQVEDCIDLHGNRRAQWLCECNCIDRNQIVITGKSLKSGNTRSCGCLQKEIVSKCGKNNKKYNHFELNLVDEHGLYGIGYCTNTGREFYFDMDDYDKIKEYTWVEANDNSGYHSIKDTNGIQIHFIISSQKYMDHIDRNPMNNRKYNLRPATYSENARNRTKPNNNTSGFIGVYWCKRSNKWCSQITHNGHRKHLGYFDCKENAIIARLNAEVKYYGDFAPQKHLFEQYNINVKDGVA